MAIARVQQFVTPAWGVNSCTFTPTLAFGLANMLEVIVNIASSSAIGAITVSGTGLTFQQVYQLTNPNGDYITVFNTVGALPATMPTITASCPGGNVLSVQAGASEFSGLASSNQFKQAAIGNTVFANAVTAAITPAAGNLVTGSFVDSFGGQNTGSFSVGTELAGVSLPGNLEGWMCDCELSALAVPITYTANGSGGYSSAIIIEYAAGGAPVAPNTTQDAVFFGMNF